MKIEEINLNKDLKIVELTIKEAFSETPDSNIGDWFSLEEMKSSIEKNIGVCLKAFEGTQVLGIIHAQQENPINGREGREKWVITSLAVLPLETGKGIGGKLLVALENEVRKRHVIKLYVHTNVGDSKVIHFYEKNGYKQAGTITDYYYDGSAVFLLKHLN